MSLKVSPLILYEANYRPRYHYHDVPNLKGAVLLRDKKMYNTGMIIEGKANERKI